MKIKSWAIVPAVLVAGASLTLAMPALDAVGQASPPSPAISIGSKAKLVARGAAVDLLVRVNCPQGQQAQLSASVIEAKGRRLIQGSQFTQVSCTGRSQNVHLLISPQTEPFQTGVALARASIFFCGFPTGCGNASATKTVQIK